ncbi:MAG: M6 family metalloprotease domain-containing protein [Bacteroidales bacterium]|nr:M6 family metalloprotease domain-containing protein [Bacteroidales bacterium]
MNKRFFTAIAVLLLAVFLPLQLLAAYVENLPQKVVQPDGSVLELLASGDEFFNYLHDANGYTIIQGADGYYYYAIRESEKVIPSPFRVDSHDPVALGLEKRVMISPELYRKRLEDFNMHVDKSAKAPHTGDMVNLVIYIRFSDDDEFTTPRSTFDDYFNKPQGPSLRHYFQEVSYGQLEIESHHFPESEMNVNLSYQSPQPRSYFQPQSETNPNGYDPNIPTNNGTNPNGRTYREQSLLVAAVLAVSQEIPLDLNLDADGDGRVDNVSFIIRGQQDGWNNLLWAHRWVLWSQVVNINGKRVYDYTFQPQTQSGVNVLCHEMFHALGAPDLYHYNSTGFTPVGPWDLMHSGFVHMGAYMKWKYAGQQWVTDIPTISDPGTYTLNPLTSPENNVFRINSINSDDEFFVVEYRKRGGHYETNIPGEGLLVYRINPLAGNGNAQGPPDEVYLFRPNGSMQSDGNVLQAHLSEQVGRTEFSDNTNPHAFLSNNLPGEILITNISAAGETISFDLMPTFDDVLPPGSLAAFVNENFEVELNWQLPEPAINEEDPALSGIQIYRRGVIIETLDDPEASSYIDSNAPSGEVTYYVRAVYGGDLVSPPTPVVGVVVPPYLLVEGETTFEVGNESGNQRLEVRSNISQWTANAAQSWVQPYPGFGSGSRIVYLYYDANPTGTPRQSTVALSGGGQNLSLTLRQGYSVSVDEQDQQRLVVYPNPSHTGYILVRFGQITGKASLRMIDLTGRTVFSQDVDAQPGQTIQINTSGFPASIYLMELSSAEGVLREKVIVR